MWLQTMAIIWLQTLPVHCLLGFLSSPPNTSSPWLSKAMTRSWASHPSRSDPQAILRIPQNVASSLICAQRSSRWCVQWMSTSVDASAEVTATEGNSNPIPPEHRTQVPPSPLFLAPRRVIPPRPRAARVNCVFTALPVIRPSLCRPRLCHPHHPSTHAPADSRSLGDGRRTHAFRARHRAPVHWLL